MKFGTKLPSLLDKLLTLIKSRRQSANHKFNKQ